MTANETRKMMQEWLNGAPRQRWVGRPDGQSGWTDLPDDRTEWRSGVVYRIKPITWSVPLDGSDLSGHAVLWVRSTPSSDAQLVLRIGPTGIKTADVFYTWADLHEFGYQWSPDRSNWHPCWKTVEK